MTSIRDEVARRRTFAIISHPDAGKTTLTEKLLLFGGAIQLAGTVKGRKAARHATSDWMRLEQPLRLTQPKIFYEFADPDLERLPSGQKLMLRIGNENAARVKAKLSEIRAAITDPALAQKR